MAKDHKELDNAAARRFQTPRSVAVANPEILYPETETKVTIATLKSLTYIEETAVMIFLEF